MNSMAHNREPGQPQRKQNTQVNALFWAERGTTPAIARIISRRVRFIAPLKRKNSWKAVVMSRTLESLAGSAESLSDSCYNLNIARIGKASLFNRSPFAQAADW